jgi:hypothetical protein
MSEKYYTFTVPAISYGVRRIWIEAESEAEAREKMEGRDWMDHQDEHDEDEHDWTLAKLIDVEDCSTEAA